jgi:hypothetical protein
VGGSGHFLTALLQISNASRIAASCAISSRSGLLLLFPQIRPSYQPVHYITSHIRGTIDTRVQYQCNFSRCEWPWKTLLAAIRTASAVNVFCGRARLTSLAPSHLCRAYTYLLVIGLIVAFIDAFGIGANDNANK